MSRQSLLRTGFIAALIFGSVAGSVTSSFAATTGRGGGGGNGNGGPSHSSGPSNPGGGGGDGGGGESEASRLVVIRQPCRTRDCGPRRVHVVPIPVNAAEQTRCSNVWRNVMLEDGSIVEDMSGQMRKHCRVIRAFD